MKLRIWFSLSIILSFAVTCAHAQGSQETTSDNEITKELSFDGRIHTSGFAFGMNYGFIKSPKRTLVFSFAIASLKHPREYKKSVEVFPGPLSRSPKAYIFGKQNYFYGLHFGIGGKHYLSEPSKRRGVSMGIKYTVGPSLGITKPYFLDLIRFSDDLNSFEIVSEQFSEENRDLFLNRATIYGASGFSNGFGNLTVYPGGHGKLGLHMDWGVQDEFIKAIEVGFMVDAYATKIPIMVTEDNRFLFMNLYLTLEFGKRS